jgi:hypothetical protein
MPELGDLIDDVGEEVSRVEELPGRIVAPGSKIAIELADLGTKTSEAIAAASGVPNVEINISGLSSGGVITEAGLNSNTEEVKVARPDGVEVDFSESLTDPEITGVESARSLSTTLEGKGVYIDPQVEADMATHAENNPTKAINRANARTAAARSAAASDPGIQAAEKAEAIGDKATAKSAIENSKTVKELNDKLDELNKKLGDKDWKSYLEKAGAWSTKAFALLVGGVLTYEVLKAYQNELTGCWQASSNGKSVTKIKISSLTCNSCCSSSGNTQPVADGTCDPKQPAPSGANCASGGGSPCSCQSTPCSGSCCSCGNTCDPDETSNCSRWCSNAVRILKTGSLSLSYSCEEPSLGDTVGDVFENIDDIISGLIGGGASFLENLLKWGAIALVVVGAILLLYFSWKFISGFSEHKQTRTSSE